jgi:membrane-anchored protein YejM (alkaline phosphatase superfamily)
MLESWRADAFGPGLTPEIARLAETSLVFRRHLSGGNATGAGVFSAFYGLHGTYFPSFTAARRGPILLDRLRELGFATTVISSRSLSYLSIRSTIFSAIEAGVDDDLPGSKVERDALAAERASAFIRSNAGRGPFFLALFLDATHAPYDSPPEYRRHLPSLPDLGYRLLDPQWPEPFHNRYRNAVQYDDHLVGVVLDALRAAGVLDASVVLITGDHGEEFREHGAFFHGSNYSDEQIHVPLILHVPGGAPAVREDRTSHVDLAPTILGLLGCTSPPPTYALGSTLLSPREPGYALTCGLDGCAVVEGDGTTTVLGDGSSAPVVFAPGYVQVDPARAGRDASPNAARALKELDAFVR